MKRQASGAAKQEKPEAEAKPRANLRVAPLPQAGDGKAPSERWLRLWDGCKMALGLALVLGSASATAFGTYRFALSSPRFEIHSVEVKTSHRLSNEALLARAGIPASANLFAIDLGAAEQKLLQDPWIRTVRITRKLPDTLHIELVEREAVALAPVASQVFLVDTAGEPFKAWSSGDPHDLPLISGLDVDAMAKDRALALATTTTALEVLEHYARLPVSKVHPAQEVHFSPDGSVVLTVGSKGIALHLGKGPWPKKLLMVAEVLKRFERRADLPGVVFLDNQLHPERVVVRMR